MATALTRISKFWNAFSTPPGKYIPNVGQSYSLNPDRPYFTGGNERSIVSALYNRVALDVSTLTIRHCRLDSQGQYIEEIKDPLDDCLNVAANIDQTGHQFIHDLTTTMFDDGVAAAVPVKTSDDPNSFGSYDIYELRVGRIIAWMPQHVRVSVYNDISGQREELVLPKTLIAIVENPLYSVMNEPNSTLQRLIRKLNLLDAIDDQSSSGKLDLILQLPYTIKSEARRKEAERRRSEIEKQLTGSKYGIAYTDGTERITQLNRSVENNLLEQIKYLTTMLYGQLGVSEAIANGTATAEEMLNYHNRTIEPIISSICDAMNAKFLTKTARSQGQTIKFFRDPFKLAPVDQIAELADKFTRNEIMTSNEFRSVLGMSRVDDPAADELRNKNLNKADSGSDMSGLTDEGQSEGSDEEPMTQERYDAEIAAFDKNDADLADLEKELK